MVMKPEPWGEALDAVAGRRAGRRSSYPPLPGEPFTQAVAAELATARAPGLRLRPLRGHRPAGDGRGRHPDGGARALDRRLRAQRRRGRGAGDRRGRRAAAARGSWATPESLTEESLRRRAAGVPRLHQARRAGAGTRCPRCCSPATTRGSPRWRHDRVRTPHRRAPPRPGPRLARGRPRRRGRRDRASPLPPTPPSCSPSSARAGCRSSRPTRACTSRRCTRTSPTCRPGCGEWTTLVLRIGGRLVGAVRGRSEGETWDVGRLMVAPDLQGRGLGRLLLDAIEQAAPDEVDRLRAVHRRAAASATSGSTRRPATACAGPTADVPGAVRLTKRAAAG